MLRRLLVVLGVALVAAALAAPALAVRVHVRVEGARTTIFGAFEPRVVPFTGTLTAEEGATVTLTEPTPLGALEQASIRGEFYYRIRSTGFGPYVDRIGRNAASGASGWVYKVNGVSPPVGAHQYVLKEGDRVLWYYATFGPAGGPKTLELLRIDAVVSCAPEVQCAPPITCFQAYAVDDNGERTAVDRVVFRVDGRAVRSRSGTFCPRGHWHRIRVTKRGFVRSEAERGRGVRVADPSPTLTGRP